MGRAPRPARARRRLLPERVSREREPARPGGSGLPAPRRLLGRRRLPRPRPRRSGRLLRRRDADGVRRAAGSGLDASDRGLLRGVRALVQRPSRRRDLCPLPAGAREPAARRGPLAPRAHRPLDRLACRRPEPRRDRRRDRRTSSAHRPQGAPCGDRGDVRGTPGRPRRVRVALRGHDAPTGRFAVLLLPRGVLGPAHWTARRRARPGRRPRRRTRPSRASSASRRLRSSTTTSAPRPSAARSSARTTSSSSRPQPGRRRTDSTGSISAAASAASRTRSTSSSAASTPEGRCPPTSARPSTTRTRTGSSRAARRSTTRATSRHTAARAEAIVAPCF